ncbi:hypothetical protein [Mesorhizobium sp. L-8-3]|uniref:hypothetical protein n=1 Tax=Mesorhizobium sp. L-8-3 TaxID=2744522 RepID=UPI001928544E|nr:hypothetical protein [Mesorhizobium sp. L-8-3]BCH25302.1 hypothetical protein MesoLjLb_50870 [Mesorhizobium sp. L-8-3]
MDGKLRPRRIVRRSTQSRRQVRRCHGHLHPRDNRLLEGETATPCVHLGCHVHLVAAATDLSILLLTVPPIQMAPKPIGASCRSNMQGTLCRSRRPHPAGTPSSVERPADDAAHRLYRPRRIGSASGGTEELKIA